MKDYSEIINWDKRLPSETPFFRNIFSSVHAIRVADMGCGTGQHAIMFAKWGLEVIALDPNEEMLQESEENIKDAQEEIEEANGSIELHQAGFTELSRTIAPDKVDVITCLGNTLPHVEDIEQLRDTFADFAQSVRAGGMVALHFLNHTKFLVNREQIIPPVVSRSDEERKVFLRLVDFSDDQKEIEMDFLTLTEDAEGQWDLESEKRVHTALPVDLVSTELAAAGFHVFEAYGNHNGKRFEPLIDESVILVGRRLHRTPTRN